MKARMKKADRSGAEYALIMGEDELDADSIVVKPLRSDQPQETVSLGDLPERLRALCGGPVEE
jgi:histidyl-tRNA synthetase